MPKLHNSLVHITCMWHHCKIHLINDGLKHLLHIDAVDMQHLLHIDPVDMQHQTLYVCMSHLDAIDMQQLLHINSVDMQQLVHVYVINSRQPCLHN